MQVVRLGGVSETEYPERQMFRAVYRQIARFLDWINRSGSGPSASEAAREAKEHRQDVASRGGRGGDFSGGGGD